MTQRRARSSRAARVRPQPPSGPRSRPQVAHTDDDDPRGRLRLHAQRTLAGAARLLTGLAPCAACVERAAGADALCRSCAAALRTAVAALPVPTGDTLWLGPHAGVWRRLVHALKYRGARKLAPLLAELLAIRHASWGWRPQLVAHLPTSEKRRVDRGYDQAELLAVALATELGLPHGAVLTRVRATVEQAGQGRSARDANVAGAFRSRFLAGRSVLLVDDVLTTGATLRAGRAALLAAGAGEVRCAVVARTAPAREEGDELADALALLG